MAVAAFPTLHSAFRPESPLALLLCLMLVLPTPIVAAQAEEASSEEGAGAEPRALEHRAERLARALESNHGDHLMQPWITGALMGAGLGFGTVGILGLTDVLSDNGGAGLLTASGATAVAGGILTFAADDSLMSPFFGATLATTGGLMALAVDRDVGLESGFHTWPAGIGAFTTAALILLDAALTASPGNAALSRDFKRLSDLGARDSLTRAEVEAIERRYVKSRSAIPRWLVVTPAALGLGVSGIWTLGDYREGDSITVGIVGGALLFQFGSLLRWSIQRDLQDADVASAGFDMALLPTGNGAALVGRF